MAHTPARINQSRTRQAFLTCYRHRFHTSFDRLLYPLHPEIFTRWLYDQTWLLSKGVFEDNLFTEADTHTRLSTASFPVHSTSYRLGSTLQDCHNVSPVPLLRQYVPSAVHASLVLGTKKYQSVRLKLKDRSVSRDARGNVSPGMHASCLLQLSLPFRLACSLFAAEMGWS